MEMVEKHGTTEARRHCESKGPFAPGLDGFKVEFRFQKFLMKEKSRFWRFRGHLTLELTTMNVLLFVADNLEVFQKKELLLTLLVFLGSFSTHRVSLIYYFSRIKDIVTIECSLYLLF